MYLTMMLQSDRVIEVKAFRNFGLAEFYADVLLSKYFPYLSVMPDWQEGSYRNAFDCPHGFTLVIEPCDPPEPMDERFQSQKYGVNLV